jgi:hypothetical protein
LDAAGLLDLIVVLSAVAGVALGGLALASYVW